MLILHRKCGEEVVIDVPSGERIVITVTAVGEARVRLGFTAARDVKILRRELLTNGTSERAAP